MLVISYSKGKQLSENPGIIVIEHGGETMELIVKYDGHRVIASFEPNMAFRITRKKNDAGPTENLLES